MRKISADYIFPVSCPPIKNGIIIIDNDGSIIDLIDGSAIDYKIDDLEIFEGIICPGFVNTHCHLELSYLKNKIEQKSGLNNFLTKLENLRKEDDTTKSEACFIADKKMKDNGIVAVGDISNNNISFEAKSKSKIYYHNFIEAFAFAESRADAVFNNALKIYNDAVKLNLKASIVPHAPYSMSEKLFSLLKISQKKIKTFFLFTTRKLKEKTKCF